MSVRLSASQMWLVAFVAVPGLAAVGARFIGAGPRSAAAAVTEPDLPALPRLRAESPEPEPAVRAAIEAAEALRQRADVRSPFEPADVAAVDNPGGRGGRASAGAGPAVSDVRIGAIYADKSRLIAVIDERARRIGDEVAPGWTLESIDVHSQTLRLRHASGTVELHRLHHFD